MFSRPRARKKAQEQGRGIFGGSEVAVIAVVTCNASQDAQGDRFFGGKGSLKGIRRSLPFGRDDGAHLG